jgi:hypothetical protein
MVQYSIDGYDAAPAKRHTDTDAEMEKTRSALREAAAWKNELLQARREHAAVHLEAVDAEMTRASQAFQQAWETGDAQQMAQSQRDIAALEVRRANTQSVAERLDRTPPVPSDPVEAFAEGRSAQAQAWIRDHPDTMSRVGVRPQSYRLGIATPSRKALPQTRQSISRMLTGSSASMAVALEAGEAAATAARRCV